MRKVLFYCSFLWLLSCEKAERQDEVKKESVKVSITSIDSVTVKGVLAKLFLFQTADQEHVVFKDFLESEVYVVNKNSGDIEYQWDKKGDVPGAFGNMVKPLVLSEKGEIVVLDYLSGLRVFQKDGELVYSGSPVMPQISFGGRVNLFQDAQVVSLDGQEYLLYSLDLIESATEFNADFLKARKNLILSNLKTNESRLILEFPQESKFVAGGIYPFEDFRPRFFLSEKENKLYLMFQNEPVLYIYDWNQGNPELLKSLEVNFPDFEENESWVSGSLELGQISDQKVEPIPARIQALTQVSGGFLVSYSSKPSSKNLYSLLKENNISIEQKRKLNTESKLKTVFVNESGQVFPVDFPEMHYQSFQIIEGEIHWMKKPNPDEEAENFTVYWGELKVE
ncbi:hypothetical protein [Algoriphagus vanfongensis]|uniref:hypothetical protein n=1 Tax=Algoriphagus vanfongensis TaxID=426371 RepID=UPI00047C4425|nr:hypothetical protein [Algoriphagus vanfongensis]